MTDINNSLAFGLDDIADLPELKPFTPGLHLSKLTVTFEPGKVEFGTPKAGKIIWNLTHVSTTEQEDPNAEPTLPGTECSVNYALDNKYAMNNLKKASVGLFEGLGITTFDQLIEKAKDLDVYVVTGIYSPKPKATDPVGKVPAKYTTILNTILA
jgi:hypothetical protein